MYCTVCACILQGFGSILICILSIRATNNLFDYSYDSPKLNMSLGIYKDSKVYYRAGDKSFESLEQTFVAQSKLNRAVVEEASPTSYIVNGKTSKNV